MSFKSLSLCFRMLLASSRMSWFFHDLFSVLQNILNFAFGVLQNVLIFFRTPSASKTSWFFPFLDFFLRWYHHRPPWISQPWFYQYFETRTGIVKQIRITHVSKNAGDRRNAGGGTHIQRNMHGVGQLAIAWITTRFVMVLMVFSTKLSDCHF